MEAAAESFRQAVDSDSEHAGAVAALGKSLKHWRERKKPSGS
jgi:hypothetical protein